ncbi:MAG: prenyltransferase/squalene oxidase repeat-containing protein, partial [Pirellulaceae bacterium]
MKRVVAVALIGAFVVCMINNATAWAYTPESEKVRKITADAIKYLVKSSKEDSLGGEALKGLAVYKYYHRYRDLKVSDIDHPQVQYAVKYIRNELQKGLNHSDKTLNYSLGIAIIFLCEIDGNQKAYRSEIETLLRALFARQRPDGAWSYPDYATGDTSQTQYGILSTWFAIKKGYQVPGNSMQRAVDWLIRTQDPSGQFPYQGYDPGPGNYNRTRQAEVRFTMSPAALGCLYIAQDSAGLVGQRTQPKSTDVFKSTKAVKR